MPSEASGVEYAVPAHPSDDDIGYAPRAVIIHRGEDWPAGTQCVNCHVPWPCSVNRWGRGVLGSAGYAEADVAGLARRARSGVVPWS